MVIQRLLAGAIVLALAACSEAPQRSAPPSSAEKNAGRASPTAVAPAAMPDVAPAAPSPLQPLAVASAKPKPATAAAASPSTRAKVAPAASEGSATSKPKPTAEPKALPQAAVALSSLDGHVQLSSGAGAAAADEVAAVAVYFVPDKGAVRAKPDRYLMYTHEKKFDPESLVVPVGSTVKFPNRDEILHNVFSSTAGSQFDLGLIGEDAAGEHTFIKPGLVLVNCNVHSAMQANILVVDTPYFTRASRDGKFSLQGLPAGTGKLTFWHPRVGFQSVAVTLPSERPIEQALTLSKPRVEPHMNKEGRTYQTLSN